METGRPQQRPTLDGLEIARHDFGITFNVPLEGGGVMVGDRIQLMIEVEAVLES